jgi:hypothetical protein
MKKYIIISILSFSLLTATVTNTANVTIGDGVTLKVTGDFVNEGTLSNDGTFSISGSLTGDITNNEGSSMGFFGGASIPSQSYENLIISGDAELSGDATTGNLSLTEGSFNLNGYNLTLDGLYTRDGGTLTGDGYIIGENNANLGLSLDTDATISLNGIALYHNGVSSISKHYMVSAATEEITVLTLQFSEDELNGLVADDLALFHSTDGEDWAFVGGTVDGNTISLGVDDANGYWTAGIEGCADPLAKNYNDGAFGGAYTCSYDYEIPFHQGANLMSFYGSAGNSSVGASMETIEMATGLIGEGVATTLNPVLGWVGSLTDISEDSGYWIKLELADTTDFEGQPMHPDIEYCLDTGANLISYSNPFEYEISDALPDNVEEILEGIIGEGVAASKVGDTWVGSLTQFKPWGGYWFKSTSEEDICFEYENSFVLPRQVSQDKIEIPEAISFIQSMKQSFYFIEDIENIEDGEFIVAMYNGVVVGSAPFVGEYSTIPVMGNDGEEYSLTYAPVNASIELYVWSEEKGIYKQLEGEVLAPFSDMGLNMVGLMSAKLIIPDNFALHQAYPNPFNPSTTINFDLPVENQVQLQVYDLQGRLVQELSNSILKAGYHQFIWNADRYASGAYLIKLTAGDFITTQKITLIK